MGNGDGDQGAPEGVVHDAAAGLDLDSVRDTALGIKEGPLKNYATIGDALKGLTELASEHTKVRRELKTALTKISELSPKAKVAADSPQGAEVWARGVEEFNKNGALSADTVKELHAITGVARVIWQRIAGVMKEADTKFSEQTQKVLNVDSAGFQKMIDEAGISEPYQDFIEEQVLNGRFGFLDDLAVDLQARGFAKPPEQQAGDQNQQQPGGQVAQGGQEQGGQVEMGQPPAQKTQKGWETESAYTTEFNDARLAENVGDNSKMDAMKARTEALEAAGIPAYPGAPEAVKLG